MKRITAYQAADNSIHRTRAEAAKASLAHLAREKSGDKRGASLDGPSVAFIVEHRGAVMAILGDIDAPEAEPYKAAMAS